MKPANETGKTIARALPDTGGPIVPDTAKVYVPPTLEPADLVNAGPEGNATNTSIPTKGINTASGTTS